MPIHTGHDSDGPFYQWGHQKKYHYKKGNKKSMAAAKSKAKKQMKAIFSSGYISESSKFKVLFEQIMSNLIKEGGHAFPNVGPIKKQNIQQTINKLNQMLFIPLGITSDMWTSQIGSVGKKDVSGDIDIAMDFNKIKKIFNVEADQQVRNILSKKLSDAGIQNRQKVNNIHLAFPISGGNNQLVQIDLFPSTDLQYIKKAKFSPYAKDSKYKGVHRKFAILALIKAVTLAIADDAADDQQNTYISPDGRTYPGIRFKYIMFNDDGIYQVTKTFKGKRIGSFRMHPDEDKSKRQFITRDFQKMLDMLFGKELFSYQKDLYSFETIWNNILMSPKFPYKDKLDEIVLSLNHTFSDGNEIVPIQITNYIKEHNL